MENVILAADHNGISLKAELVQKLKSWGYNPIDLGPFVEGVSVDYVDYAYQLAHIVASGSASKGILICGTGVGMSIVANRVPKVRASLVHNMETSEKTREHNDSNVICLGAWINNPEENSEIVKVWLEKSFGEGRHNKRIVKIDTTPGVVITNGVFDVLHKGHLDLLKFAKNCGSKLIVAMDSDRRVKELKGPDRPVNNESLRREILLSIKHVDEVIVFDSDEELKMITLNLMPETLVKGGEWTTDEIRKRDCVPEQIKIVTLPLTAGHSTTQQLKKIRELTTHEKVDIADR